MNKNKPTANRISWTVQALNAFLPIYNDVENLQINRYGRVDTYREGTHEDIAKLYDHIKGKVGPLNRPTAWNTFYLYDNNDMEIGW